MTQTTCYEQTAKRLIYVYLHCNLCYSGDLLTPFRDWSLKTHCWEMSSVRLGCVNTEIKDQKC